MVERPKRFKKLYIYIYIFMFLNQKLSIFGLFNQFLSFTESGLRILVILLFHIFAGSGTVLNHHLVRIQWNIRKN